MAIQISRNDILKMAIKTNTITKKNNSQYLLINVLILLSIREFSEIKIDGDSNLFFAHALLVKDFQNIGRFILQKKGQLHALEAYPAFYAKA